MTVAVGDVLRVVAKLIWDDAEIAMNVYDLLVDGGGGPFDDGDLVLDVLDWVEAMYAEWVATMSDELNGSEVAVYKYDTVGLDFDEVGTESWTFTPTNVVDQLPRGVACLLNLRSDDPDVLGKKYIPGITENGAQDGLWTAGLITVAAAYVVELITPPVGALTGATFETGVWSVKNSLHVPLTGTVTIPTTPAYQRRRKRGVGI